METIANRIRRLRKSMELSQETLGKKIGVGKTTISNWETGYSSPDPDSIIKLSEIFLVTTDYLLGKVNDQNLRMIEKNELPESIKDYIDYVVLSKDSDLSAETIQEIIKYAELVFNKKREKKENS